MLGVKEMSAEVDIMSDIFGKQNVDKDDVILTLSRNVSNANTVAMEYVNGQIRLSEK